MPFLITNVYHQWNTCNSYSWVKKSYGHQTTLFLGISGGTKISTVDHDELNNFLLHPFTTSVARLYRVATWTRNRCQQPLTSTRNDVIPSVDASKIYFVASLLTQYWLACKLTCTKRNFDSHQSVTDITAAIGTPWLHKLWLGLVLTTGKSSFTAFVLTSVDRLLCLWPSAKLQPNFGFKMKLSCRGHDHALPFAYDLFRVTYLIWNHACTCVHMHTEDRKHLWLFIVAGLRWRHDFPSTIFCIHNVHDKLYCSMNNYRWKCRHLRNVLCHSIKVSWSS